jgi:RHS repeat-associated protein
MYAATTGTFLQRDPLGQPGQPIIGYSHEAATRILRSSQSNLYAYVGNNPLSFVDPYGLEKQVLCADGSVRTVPDNTDPALACGGRGGLLPINPASPSPQLGLFLPQTPAPPSTKPKDGFYIAYEKPLNEKARNCKCLHTDIVRVAGGSGSEIRTGAGGKSRGNRMPKPNDFPLVQSTTGALGFGTGKGTPCSQATRDQIASCISEFPKKSYLAPVNNCQSDVTDAALGCCMTSNKVVGPGQFIAHALGGIGGEGW